MYGINNNWSLLMHFCNEGLGRERILILNLTKIYKCCTCIVEEKKLHIKIKNKWKKIK
jgi:hypothetical protein